MELQFLGAARQVTGSCFYLKAGGLNLLVDCGLYQERDFRDRNWESLTIPPDRLDYVLLTHAHLDHTGRLPKLVHDGFRGEIYATRVTGELTKIVLADSAKIQEEDALNKKRRHEREGRKGPHPEIPLYTVEDAKSVFPLLREAAYKETVPLNDNVSICFHDAGHILGSSMLEVTVRENNETRNVIFSGDIGQWNRPIVSDPSALYKADYIVMESTYGDREHETEGDLKQQLAEVINDTVERGGNIIIPTFAIERAQELLYHFSELVREDKIPHLMIFLDSPMAVNVTDIFSKHTESMDKETRAMFAEGEPPFKFPGLRLVRSVGESKSINRIKGSCIVMAGSGMCTGGRIKHHLVKNIDRPESTILFVGYQAKNTLGRTILENNGEDVRILGQYYPVRARIAQLHGMSAHADRAALLRWLGFFRTKPSRLFVTHGEEESAFAFAETVREKMGWDVLVPDYQEKVTL